MKNIYENLKVKISDDSSQVDINHLSDYIYTIIKNEVNSVPIDLLEKGFQFHDRCLEYSINLQNTFRGRKAIAEKLIEFDIRVEKYVNSQMYLIAKKALISDKRFCLDAQMPHDIANMFLEEYIKYYNNMKPIVFSAWYQKRMLGFTVAIRKNEREFENVLGATEPGITGKMIAFPLYNYMLNYMAEKKYSQYYGVVSSANMNSINLHNQLGGKVIGIYDKYIYKNKDMVI